MSITRAPRPTSNWYQLDKRISEDKRLSWAARGLLIYLLGKPDHWTVSPAALVNETKGSMKPSGRDSVYALLKELLTAGYLRRIQNKKSGQFDSVDYIVSEAPGSQEEIESSPHTDFPDTAQPDTGEPHTANPTQVNTDSKQGLKPQAKKERRAARTDLSFAEWIETCKTSGERPVPESDPVFEYAEKAGLPLDYIVLHWKEFKERYATDGKRYKDWRAVYRKSVRGNWFRLWFFNADGVCTLTTQGQQANRIHKEQE